MTRSRSSLPNSSRPPVPLLGVLISLLLMASLPMEIWLRLFIWLIIGRAVYFSYGRYLARSRG